MEIIKELGNGMFGTTYKIKENNKYYALKREYILESDLIDNELIKQTNNSHWREIFFANHLNKLYPDQFMKLYEYEIIKNCEHKQKYTIKREFIPKYFRDKFDKLAKSKYCIEKKYELIDGTIKDIFYKLNQNEKYSIIAQLAGIIKILEKHKYLHGDFHSGNMGYIITKKKYVTILGHKIPTYGYIVKAIDYGSILHQKFNMTKSEKKEYKLRINTEFISIINTVMIDRTKFFDYIEKNKIKLDYKKDKEKILNSQLKDILSRYTSNKDIIFILADILYKKDFQKIILGKKYKEYIEVENYFDDIDFIYMAENKFNLDKIIKYCILKLNLS
jgi:hypothetical protein